MSPSISHPKQDSGTRLYRALFYRSSLPREKLLQQASNSVITGTFPHQTCSMRGFNTTGEGLWQALVQCFRTSSTGIPPVISKVQSALEWDVTAAAALCTGRGKMVTLTHTFKSLSFLRVSHRGERGKLTCYTTQRYFFCLKSVSPKA